MFGASGLIRVNSGRLLGRHVARGEGTANFLHVLGAFQRILDPKLGARNRKTSARTKIKFGTHFRNPLGW